MLVTAVQKAACERLALIKQPCTTTEGQKLDRSACLRLKEDTRLSVCRSGQRATACICTYLALWTRSQESLIPLIREQPKCDALFALGLVELGCAYFSRTEEDSEIQTFLNSKFRWLLYT